MKTLDGRMRELLVKLCNSKEVPAKMRQDAFMMLIDLDRRLSAVEEAYGETG